MKSRFEAYKMDQTRLVRQIHEGIIRERAGEKSRSAVRHSLTVMPNNVHVVSVGDIRLSGPAVHFSSARYVMEMRVLRRAVVSAPRKYVTLNNWTANADRRRGVSVLLSDVRTRVL